jgi:hypothetical protein
MIGAELLCQIIERIEFILADADAGVAPKFGQPGFPVMILVGDFAQLPPIGDTPLFAPLDSILITAESYAERAAAERDLVLINGRVNLEGIESYFRDEQQQQPAPAPGNGAHPVPAAQQNQQPAAAAAAQAPAAAAAARGGRGGGGGRARGGGADVAAVPPAPGGKGKKQQQQQVPLAAVAAVNNFAASKFARRVRGLKYISYFPDVKLKAQMRADGDEKQGALVEYMTSNGHIPDLTDGDFAMPHIDDTSSPADIKRFRFAPFATSTNRRRRAINFAQAQSFAAERGVPLVVWRKRFNAKHVNQDVLDGFADPSSAYYGHFVAGAPAQLVCNVVPHLCISNGTSAVMHSLTWHDAQVGAAMRRRILAAPPGALIEVTTPDFVNVVIRSTHALPLTPLPDDHYLFDRQAAAKQQQQYIFPMQLWCVRKPKEKRGQVVMPAHQAHQLELGFAFTLHKLQGATLDALVLDLNFGSAMMATFSAVYVGLTRVRAQNDIRLLPVASAKMSMKLRELRFDPHLRRWLEAD